MTVTLPLYRPSNATEGEAFAAAWCASCEARPACDLPARTQRHKAQRWHWHAAMPRPGRRPTGHARTRDKAKRELLAYVQCAARESRLAA